MLARQVAVDLLCHSAGPSSPFQWDLCTGRFASPDTSQVSYRKQVQAVGCLWFTISLRRLLQTLVRNKGQGFGAKGSEKL